MHFEDFRYWIIFLDFLKNQQRDDCYLNNKYDLPQADLFISHTDVDGSIGSHSVAMLEVPTNCDDIDSIYMYDDSILDSRFIMRFVKVKLSHIKNILDTEHYNCVTNLRDKMEWNLSNIHSAIGKESIFGKNSTTRRSPIILYIEPLADEIPSSTYDDILAFTGSHRCVWTSISGCLIANFKSYVYAPWEGLTFINPKSLASDDCNIYMPNILFQLARHIICFHFLNYHLVLMNGSKLAIKKWCYHNDYKQAVNANIEFLASLEEYSSYKMSVLNNINHVLSTNRRTDALIKNAVIEEPDYVCTSLSIISKLQTGIVDSLKELNIQIELLDTSSKTIAEFYRDSVSARASMINLKLQKSLIWLTVLLIILTLFMIYEPAQQIIKWLGDFINSPVSPVQLHSDWFGTC